MTMTPMTITLPSPKFAQSFVDFGLFVGEWYLYHLPIDVFFTTTTRFAHSICIVDWCYRYNSSTVYIHSLYGLRDVVHSHIHLNYSWNLSMNSMDFPIILKYYWNIEPKNRDQRLNSYGPGYDTCMVRPYIAFIFHKSYDSVCVSHLNAQSTISGILSLLDDASSCCSLQKSTSKLSTSFTLQTSNSIPERYILNVCFRYWHTTKPFDDHKNII